MVMLIWINLNHFNLFNVTLARKTKINHNLIETFLNEENNLSKNPKLNENVTVRFNDNKRNVLKYILESEEVFDFVICNPPFHSSAEEAAKGSLRKNKNLGQKVADKPVLNFSGQNNELWCEGGELAFVTNMIYESVHFKSQCKWFSAIISKKTNLKPLYKQMKKVEVKNSTTLHLTNGNKTTQIICWQF